MSPSRLEALTAALDRALGARIAARNAAHGELTIEIAAADVPAVMPLLKTDEALAFTQMSDLAGVDYLSYGEADWQTRAATSSGFSRGVSRGAVHADGDETRRFAVVYQLLSVTHNHRLRVKVYPQGTPPRVDSVAGVWPVANWFEREAFDLFGILFDGHPDLRRILTDYGFIGHPFRKDFPLEGHVEVRYDPDKGRVVNQPVTIEPRTLVPRVIREEDWLHSSQPVSESGDA
jgi:NADH-quinone oxidoreductase subunit C